MNATDTPRAGYIAGLRALADLLEQHPEEVLPLPYQGVHMPMSFAFHGLQDGNAGALAAAGRILIPGARVKDADSEYFRLTGKLRGLAVECWAMRDQVCERVVTGTREITREVPDPEALAAVPTTTVVETVEDVQWRCTPLLAPAPVPA